MARLIDADNLIGILESFKDNAKWIGANEYAINAFDCCIIAVAEQPTIEAVPVVYAEWLEAEDGDGIVCSRCGEDFCTLVNETDRFKMYPNCGADMRKGGVE